MTVLVETAPHEFAANFIYDENGLTPFFAADRRVKQGNGSQRGKFSFHGEKWTVKLYYQSSGLKHPGPETPAGTPFQLDEMREYRLAVTADDDPVGQRKFSAHLAPRWHGMESKNGGEISLPEGIQEGVNVKVNGSNIEFDQYNALLRLSFGAVGIGSHHFEDPHPYSNIQDAERYVRLHKRVSSPIHARDGPIASMGHLLENDREGYRKLVQNDTDDYGRSLQGYYHTVTLGPKRIGEAFPGHRLPKEVKHYYAREAYSKPISDPLAHPKLGVSYQVNRWKQSLGIDRESLERLNRELEETVLAILAEAGIAVRPGNHQQKRAGPFFIDEYFDASETDRERDLISLDLVRLQQSQESVVIRHIADGLSPVQWEALEVLVTDGGNISPRDIATTTGRHEESVRRALRALDELVERKYGAVALRSRYVAEMVYEAVAEARRATRRAVEVSAKAVDAVERGLDEGTSAFIAWAAKHGIDPLNQRDARLQLRFKGTDSVNEKRRLVREGWRLWQQSGQKPGRYRMAEVRFGDDPATSSAHYYL